MPVAPWRTRAYIYSHAPLSVEEFLVGNFKIILRPDVLSPDCEKGVYIIDVTLEGLDKSNPEEAHIIGMDTLEAFIDRLSIISYAPCEVLKVISTCPIEVIVDKPFSMVTLDLFKILETPKINPDQMAPFNKLADDSPVLRSAHLVRQALSVKTVEQRLLYLHSAAELIALDESDERVKNKCPECKHEWDGPKSSRRAVRKLLQDRNVSREDVDDAMEYRGRIAHGGGQRNVAFNKRVTELAGAIEGAVISTIANRANVTAQRRMDVVTGFLPPTLHKAVKRDDGTFELINSELKAPIRFLKLDDDVSVIGGKAMAGCSTTQDGRFYIDPAAWPS